MVTLENFGSSAEITNYDDDDDDDDYGIKEIVPLAYTLSNHISIISSYCHP